MGADKKQVSGFSKDASDKQEVKNDSDTFQEVPPRSSNHSRLA
ncbi:hypothetical protein [Varibaculum prostatecancerukia]|nr:hypothetical protein [Varibaculum prostatecancerukia]